MGLPQAALPVIDVDEYLDIERASEIRHEFLDGLIYAMAGESPEHSTICFNLAVAVGVRLGDGSCRGYSPNMKVRNNPADLFSYPDLAVVCGEPVYHDSRRDILINPTVVFEVLSRSTAAYDRGEKSRRYRNHIVTLQNYVLISQTEPRIENYTRRSDRTWTQSDVTGLSAMLELPSISCNLPLAELYRRLDFAAA